MTITPLDRQTIVLLPPEVAEQIAAGEVIERPMSVLKELLENAIDAGAREIKIEVRGGGLRLVRVSDDGCGIPADEVELAFHRHATSKIRAVEDLSHLRSLGFRGEALASIAAVAEVTMITEAEASGLATQVTVRAGEVIERGRRARSRGTTVIVRDLFQNVPARLHFLKGARTETAQLAQLARRYAIAYPHLKVGLVLDGHTAFQTSGSTQMERAIAEAYDLALADALLKIGPIDIAGAEIDGVIGARALSQAGKQHLMLFVNGRWVLSQSLLAALELGYRPVLPKGRHPLAAISVRVPPEAIDANIHPTKAEVKLLHEEEICTTLKAAVHDVLGQSALQPPEEALPGPGNVYQYRLPLLRRRRGLPLAEQRQDYDTRASPADAGILAELAPLAQIRQTLILAEDAQGGLYLIDQHRAHERILYEHLRHRLIGHPEPIAPQQERHYATISDEERPGNLIGRHEDETNPAEEALASASGQLLLEPVVIELSTHQAAVLGERLPVLAALGFACERFGGHSFLMRSVPALAGGESLSAHLPALAAEAAEEEENWQDRFCAAVACHAALRRGAALSLGEQRELLANLRQTSAPAVCPHGSPLLLHYSQQFFIRQFDW
ncbi:MAG TPA: DNA mismatch repair endonuclease MutL [Ktedonobacterales bacterium]|nr:DNA mismatch repair endonuclease MutL [Ktedonobacterales bacterium]